MCGLSVGFGQDRVSGGKAGHMVWDKSCQQPPPEAIVPFRSASGTDSSKDVEAELEGEGTAAGIPHGKQLFGPVEPP